MRASAKLNKRRSIFPGDLEANAPAILDSAVWQHINAFYGEATALAKTPNARHVIGHREADNRNKALANMKVTHMHSRHLFFAIFLLLVSVCYAQGSYAAAVAGAQDQASTDPGYIAEDPRLTRLVGMPGPAITLNAIEGKPIELLGIYGKKPVYLKLWATYCIPCRKQMPGFEKTYERVGDQMQIVAVNAGIEDDAAKVRAFAEKTTMHMPIAIDDGSLGAWLKMQETPIHLLIGRDGRIAYAGHQDGPKLDAAITKVLDSAASASPIKAATVDRLGPLKVGDSVPTIELRSADDKPMQLQGGVANHPRAIFFTAVWCESYLEKTEPDTAQNCKRFRQEIAQLASASRVEWLGIANHLWTGPQTLGEYQKKTKQRINFAVDSNDTAFRTFGIHRFPAVALIDANGKLVRVIEPDDKDLTSAVNHLGKRG